MKRTTSLPSFQSYEQRNKEKKQEEKQTDEQREEPGETGLQNLNGDSGLPSLKEYAIQNNGEVSLSPLSGGSGYSVSQEARNGALEFAHPVDMSIIKTLDNPAINSVFNKVVQTSIDASYGIALATGIHVSQNTYGALYQIVVDCAKTLGIPVPYVIISDSVHGINACTAGTNQFAFIAVSSMLPLIMKQDELRFVIGHECGHLALGHVVYHTAISMMGAAGGLLPLVGPVITKTISYPLNAWGRRSEISADRAGLICCGSLSVAKRALFKLEAGMLKIDDVDIDEYVRESEQILEGSTFGKLSELNMEHPIIPKRIKALDCFAHSEVYLKCTGQPAEKGRKYLTEEQLKVETEKIIEVM